MASTMLLDTDIKIKQVRKSDLFIGVKPKNEYMNEYMKNRHKELSQVTYLCEACNKNIKMSNKNKHNRTQLHKLLEYKLKMEQIKLQLLCV